MAKRSKKRGSKGIAVRCMQCDTQFRLSQSTIDEGHLGDAISDRQGIFRYTKCPSCTSPNNPSNKGKKGKKFRETRVRLIKLVS